MDYALLFPGRFLKSAEFRGKDVTLTIHKIRTEELPDDKAGTKVKGILGFAETKKELVINRTNAESIKGMFGRETDQWIGKRVTFYPAAYTDPFTGEVGTAIRVRGSPDLKADLPLDIQLPRKKPVRIVMKKTGGRAVKAAPPPPEDEPPAPSDDQFVPDEGAA